MQVCMYDGSDLGNGVTKSALKLGFPYFVFVGRGVRLRLSSTLKPIAIVLKMHVKFTFVKLDPPILAIIKSNIHNFRDKFLLFNGGQTNYC